MNYAEYVNQFTDPDNLTGKESRNNFIRRFEEERPFGVKAVLQQAEITHEACRSLTDEDVEFFSNAVALNISQRLDLAKLGSRLHQLRELLHGQLEAFALLHLILQGHQPFKAALKSAASANDVHAIQLLDDILDSSYFETIGRPDGWTVDLCQTGFRYFEEEYPKYT